MPIFNTRYALLLGGNLGDVRQAFAAARLALSDSGHIDIVHESRIYASEAWGFSGPDFLNVVLTVDSDWSPETMLSSTQQIEKDLGRKAKTSSSYESRPVDIDLLFAVDIPSGKMIVRRSRHLSLPHPRITLRRFTLLPLAEFWASRSIRRHPVSYWLDHCPDSGRVWLP